VIPKRLHHIWVGPRALPTEWVTAWAAMHPGWTTKVWREADLAALPMKNRALFKRQMAAECWHGAADVARLEILYQQGGVYTDVDIPDFLDAPLSLSGLAVTMRPSPASAPTSPRSPPP